MVAQTFQELRFDNIQPPKGQRNGLEEKYAHFPQLGIKENVYA